MHNRFMHGKSLLNFPIYRIAKSVHNGNNNVSVIVFSSKVSGEKIAKANQQDHRDSL